MSGPLKERLEWCYDWDEEFKIGIIAKILCGDYKFGSKGQGFLRIPSYYCN